MSNRRSFPPGVAEKIRHYVYMLLDPRTDPAEPFYVGKGKGDRIFDHLHAAIESPQESDKLERIRKIISDGMEVRHIILRHGLETDGVATELESAFIDFLPNLTNVAGGAYAQNRGLMSVDEVISEYQAPNVIVVEPAILIKINRLYRRAMSRAELYDATRKSWVVNRSNVECAKFGFAVAFGVIRQVYEITEWYPSEDDPARWAFRGEIAEEMSHYIGGSVAKQFSQGAQNPIKYVNCNSKP